jgi:diguanylate cyclase (GGDEF)-like protein/PAS domain S-box-containing protein
MPTIQSQVRTRSQKTPTDEFSSLTRDELEVELGKLRRREALFDATEQVANIGHYEWSYEHDRLESCSEAYANLFNMSVEEVMASQDSWKKTLQYIHPDDHERYRLAENGLRDTRSFSIEYRILLADGSIRHVHEVSIVVLDDEGIACGDFGLLQDISEQVKYDRDLEYRDELARQTETITDIGHFIYDEENERYIYLSEGCARIYGSTASVYKDRMNSVEDDLADIVAEDRSRVEEEYRHYIETGQDCALEFRIQRPDGTVRWLRELIRAKQIKGGRVSQTLGVVQDINERVEREQELMFKDAMANQAEAITDIGYFLFDEIKDQHLFVSQGQARIVGLEVEEYLGKVKTNEDYIALVYPEDRELLRKAYRDVLDDHGDWEIEYRVRRPDGDLRWVREVGKAHKRNGDQVEQTIGVVQDITEQKKIQQELQYKDALANQAEALTDIGHFIYDEIRRKYLFVSPGLANIFGMDANDMVINIVSREGDLKTIHVDDRARVQRVYDRFMAGGGGWQVEYRLLRSDGEVRWVREMGKSLLMTHGIPERTIGVMQDITEQKNVEQEIINARDTLEQQVVERTRELANTVQQLQVEIEEREKIAAELDFLANHDALTGLPSLRLCKDRLDQSLAEARRNRQTSAVMFLDLDGFKDINDQHGHEFGDLVLKATAERIRDEIRETDTVARIGGDEFVIILSSLPESDIADRIAASVIKRIAQPVQIQSTEVTISASIGISLYPENGITAEELIRSADKAMYKVKHQGKNSFGFASSADPQVSALKNRSL